MRQVAVAVGDTVERGPAAGCRSSPERTRRRRSRRRTRHTDGRRARGPRAVRERHALGLDAARPEAVAKRRDRGRRTARENLAELVDEGTFVEYGPLMFAAQERRRSREELMARTPADGLVGGVGDVDGRPCVVMSYDYTVLAGTQGMRNHLKKDRLFDARRAPPPAGRAVRRGRRRAARATSTCRSSPASTAERFSCSRG